MARESILVVEDDEDILELISYNLSRHGFRVRGVGAGEEALEEVRADPPDLILLDLLLPGMDGFDVCRALKQDGRTAQIPVMMLTARVDESDIVAGLELGADDYMVKPFSPKVLLARVRAILRRRPRRGAEEQEESVEAGPLVIRLGRHEALLEGRAVELTHSELRLLHLLARRPGWVFTRNQILDALRGSDYVATDRSVDVHVAALRKKLGPAADCIETVRNVGYRFRES